MGIGENLVVIVGEKYGFASIKLAKTGGKKED
jgi:hypothetical protein